jgi:hypothetical protein
LTAYTAFWVFSIAYETSFQVAEAKLVFSYQSQIAKNERKSKIGTVKKTDLGLRGDNLI